MSVRLMNVPSVSSALARPLILVSQSDREMENPHPHRYREAAVALELEDLENSTYRAFLSRGRIAGRVRRLLGGGEWDFRRPLLERDEADRFRDDLTRIGVDAHWQGPIIAISDPRGRWRAARIAPDRHGLYNVGRFGRAVRSGSGFERDWQEVVPLPSDGPLPAATIAAALDTGLPLGPGFDRIEKAVEVRVLLEALPLCRTDHARERISVLLAGHSGVAEAIAALPELVGFLSAADRNLRNSAAYAIATIAGRAGAAAALSAEPNLAAIIRDRWRSETDAVVRDELQAALGVLGEPPLEPRDSDAERFVEQVREAFGFLVVEYGFGDPTVEDRWSGTIMTYRNETTAVVASADWRDSVVDVFLVPLRKGVLPESLNGVGNSLTPSLLLELLEGAARKEIWASPRDPARARRILEREAAALRRCEDALGGDFVRFAEAVARLHQDGNA
jgi:hypothetical protein